MKLDTKGIELLPADDRVRVYSQLADHYKEMSREAFTDGAKLMFGNLASEMSNRANAVTVFAL
jgi:hypothetical protein